MTAGKPSAAACTDVYPFAVEKDKVCIVAGAAETPEQKKDFLAHCRNATAERYLGFERNDDTGQFNCLFRPSTNLTDSLVTEAGKSGPANRLHAADDLPVLVEAWSSRCLKKERDNQADKMNCWLEAAQAIDGYSADVDAAMAHQLNELQAAWLRRARDLLAMQIRDTMIIQPASAAADPMVAQIKDDAGTQIAGLNPACPPDNLNSPNCTAGMFYENSLGVESLPEPSNHGIAPIKRVKRKPLMTKTHASKPSRQARARLPKSKAQHTVGRDVGNKRNLNPPQVVKQVVFADRRQVKMKAAQQLTRQNHSFQTKTATTSKCFVSPDWC
jgi:hypothetical protein